MASASGALRVSEIIDQRPLSRFQINTILLCGLVLVLDGFDTQSIGFLAPSMAESLHLRIGTFGPVFAAALIGLMVASMVVGPIADRIGRKIPIVVATLTFAFFALATANADTFDQLVAFRLLTGLGLGGAIPNVVALTAEYAPKRLQQTLVTMLFCSMPLGALLGGLVSSVMLPSWGWRSVFYAGGILPLVVALLLIKLLPESIRFLGTSCKRQRAMGEVLIKIAPDVAHVDIDFAVPVEDQSHGTIPVVQLFTEGRAIGTILLWVPFFMNLLMLYFIVTWLPALLRQTHMPVFAGILAVSIFSLGGILGSLFQGRIMSVRGSFSVLIVEFAVSVILIGCLGSITSFPGLIVSVFVLGCLIQGAQAGLNALAATFYPTSVRSTGVGWALGIGRVGSIVGPILGGIMVSHAWTLQQIFLGGALPALIAALAILLSCILGGSANPYDSKVYADARPYRPN